MIVNAYLPSTVFPTGLSTEGLPIGLQAVSAPSATIAALNLQN